MGPQLVRCGKLTMLLPSRIANPLQWGRNLFVAESAKHIGNQRYADSPSMGPQLVRCGKYRGGFSRNVRF